MASIHSSGYMGSVAGSAVVLRANVIAAYDYLKRELPDVFFVQDPTLKGHYPLNFAGRRLGGSGTDLDYVLPLNVAGTTSGEGIYGASYYAAAGIYKNLGYLPHGYDGVDNGGIVGLVDDLAEGVNSTNHDQVLANLQAHRHK